MLMATEVKVNGSSRSKGKLFLKELQEVLAGMQHLILLYNYVRGSSTSAHWTISTEAISG